MNYASFSNELPNSRTASSLRDETPGLRLIESRPKPKRRVTPLTRQAKQPDDPNRFTTTLKPTYTEPVVTAYSRPQRETKTYEVLVVLGANLRPVSDVFKATSPGLAKLAAKDKYGSHVQIADHAEVKEHAVFKVIEASRRRQAQ